MIISDKVIILFKDDIIEAFQDKTIEELELSDLKQISTEMFHAADVIIFNSQVNTKILKNRYGYKGILK